MKKLTILLLVLFAYSYLPAQTAQKETFLVVKAVRTIDNRNEQSYFLLEPSGPSRETDITALVPYNRKQLYHEKTGTDFYFLRSDTSKTYFNYFKSQEEVLQYLTERKWVLITVISEVVSRLDRVYNGYEVFSAPVFYMKRNVMDR
jgi:hypothetical protein